MNKLQKKQVRKTLKHRLRKLPRHTLLTVAQMYGNSRWSVIPKGHRLAIGQYVKWLVNAGKLPLVRDIDTGSHHKRYRRL